MTSLVHSIALQNFKGFSKEVRIELRPITLLFGANSAGKSSVLQALQYVREILERQNANADRTLQGGLAVDLGGFRNLVHGRDLGRCIEIEIGMVLGDTSIPELVPEAWEESQAPSAEVWSMYDSLNGIRRKVSEVGVRLTVGWSEQREAPVVLGYQISTNGEWCVRIEARADGRDVAMRINRRNPIFMVDLPPAEEADAEPLFFELDDFVNPVDLGSEHDLSEEPELSPTDNPPLVQQYSVLPEVLLSVREAGLERPGEGLREWLGDFRGALPRLDCMLSVPAPDVHGADNIYVVREFTAFLSWLTIGPAKLLLEQLQKLRYLGPLRRIPPRGFDRSLTRDEAAWADGMAAWETLLSGSKDLVDRVGDWMQSSDKLGTGYAVHRYTAQEFDLSHGEPQPSGPACKRVRLVDAAGQTHQPQDVGVGISQVLPVVVAAQEGGASLVCIEQPELHIHPAVQVGLGDLLIDGVVNQELSFLIETHSEHLILRLLRRIREASEAPFDRGVTPGLVGICCFTRREGIVVVDDISVTREGDFTKPWPQGFFDERGPELF